MHVAGGGPGGTAPRAARRDAARRESPPDLDWAALRETLRPLRTRLIVTGARPPPPGVRYAATLEGALPLLPPRAALPTAPSDGPAPAETPAVTLTLIGASTGGPRVLQELLSGWQPRGAVVIAQHLSEGFSDNLTQWLGTLTPAPVLSPTPGETLRPGTITVVSGTHVTLQGDTLSLQPGQPGREYLPSIDRLFLSALSWRGALNAMLLSGMGDDGAAGLAALHAAGARSAVQDPASATVPSMPAQALTRVNPGVLAAPRGLRAFLERHA
ncbi:chemotaxis protein CheB [Deinococcus sp. JMULE3]|uniref:chemotaxis protein CheB n=1 Tax=Deinococcus sp. JMULE3 TaxID=2518341 RepID=UPI0015754BE4|nr:chemotaxis protein CheB [Deinococcus sp. JMULE3]